jgi:YidC/Oxa1 family membrane protein insertase
MDRRTITALVLMALVIVVTPLLFPRHATTPRPDSVAAMTAGASSATPATAVDSVRSTPSTAQQPPPVAAQPGRPAPSASAPPATRAPLPAHAESIAVSTRLAQYVYLNPGAVPATATVPGFRNLRPGHRDSALVVRQRFGPLLRYRLALGADTISLDDIPFSVQTNGSTTTFTSTTPAMTLSYETVGGSSGDGYHTAVRGTVANAPQGSALLIDLPSELRSVEADTLDDQRHLAYGYKIPLRDPQSIGFSKLDANVVRTDTGSFQWVDAHSKYWLVALMQPTGQKAAGVFRGLTMRGGTRVGRIAPVASATTVYPIVNGTIAFDTYIGPQSWNVLHALGNDMENVNPYASFLRVVVQPFVLIVMRVLLWMKATFHISYGWVLIIFGIVIRLALWPLNQKAMRTSLQMQRLQPELQELQKRYKNEPEKQRDSLVKLYKEHNMSPLSPMLGCLPMLLPMPVLYALYYVFGNTIEFRGVPFLWLPDLALRDPYYITPLLMGASMFVLSWIGMRAAPPNPQAKMMSYMMPVMFTVMFINFASGLNLYYAVQNLAALPQQWIIARERAKVVPAGTASATVKRRT